MVNYKKYIRFISKRYSKILKHKKMNNLNQLDDLISEYLLFRGFITVL